jgi:methionyl-tRNA formyltransferase
MKVGLLCSSPVVYGAMSFLFETGDLAGVAVPSDNADLIVQLESYSSQYQFKFNTIDLQKLETSLLEWLKEIEPDVVFVFMFSKRIPASVISVPKYGFINFHGGKLPEYRSPVPDFWMIRNGEKQGMLTAHRMDESFDSGPILFELKLNFSENETSGTLITKFGQVLSYCMERTLEELVKGNPGIQQDESKAKYYKRPGEHELICNFKTMPANEVHALVRAASHRYKGAITKIGTRPVRILETSLPHQNEKKQINPGVVVIDRVKREIWIGCADNSSVRIDVVDLFEGVFTGYRFAEYSGLRDGEIIN